MERSGAVERFLSFGTRIELKKNALVWNSTYLFIYFVHTFCHNRFIVVSRSWNAFQITFLRALVYLAFSFCTEFSRVMNLACSSALLQLENQGSYEEGERRRENRGGTVVGLMLDRKGRRLRFVKIHSLDVIFCEVEILIEKLLKLSFGIVLSRKALPCKFSL